MRGRITATTDLEAAGAATDHVIETVFEDLGAKTDVLQRLDEVCRAQVILASNTSQFAISKLAAATGRPDRVIGSHWFNPPAAMGLIEVVRGVATSDSTLAQTLELAHRYGKETIVCKKDTQGFITSRLIALFMVEAARIVERASPMRTTSTRLPARLQPCARPARDRRPLGLDVLSRSPTTSRAASATASCRRSRCGRS